LALSNLDEKIRNNIELSFYGFVAPKVQKSITELGLNPIVKINPYIPHQEAIKQMVNSEILLCVIHEVPGNKGILTGKLFEYARSYNYILAIGPKDGEAAQFLKQTSCGQIFDYQDDLSEIIIQRYNLWLNKEAFEPNIQEINKFSRRHLTEKLVNIFYSVLEVTSLCAEFAE
jgi:hypothetical protein